MFRLSLILFLWVAPSAFAQNHYVDVDRGSGTVCTDSEPCSLTQAITNASADDTIYILIRRSGDELTIDGDYGPLNFAITVAAYTRTSTEATSATLSFTGEFELGELGKFLPHSKVTAQFENLVIADGNTYPFGEDSDDPGTVAISSLEAGFVTIHQLDVKSNLVIKRLETTTSSPVVIIEELQVSKGATLTVGLKSNDDGSNRENPAHLRVPLRQATSADDKYDNLIVHGTIDGGGSLLIAHDNSATGRGASDFNLHVTADYTPTGEDDKIDHTDCVTLEGDGEIRSDLYVIAAGNICVSMKKIGSLVVTGSIQADEYTTEMITTDLIFREDVVISGNIEQWNDAKILFEKASTIQGSVILDSGPFTYPVLTAVATGSNSIDIGTPRDNFNKTATSGDDLIIRGVRRSDKESCWPTYRENGHLPTRPLEDQWISGIRFEGPSDIANDLDLRHYFDNRDHEGTSQDNTGAAQRCLIAVDYWIERPPLRVTATEGKEVTSTIGGDILAENGGSINLFGDFRFNFNPDFSSPTTLYFNHHVWLDGDIIADGQFGLSIWEGNETRNDSYRGSCSLSDGTPESVNLTGSSLLVLTDKRDHSIVLGNGNMRMFTLAIHEKVRVRGGNLFARAIHVAEGGELISDENVQVGWSDPSLEHSYWDDRGRGRLILEGAGLDGSLHSDSYVVGLTYASTRTDHVDANLIRGAGNLHVVFNLDEDRSMRLGDALVTEFIGLCSGTVILEDPDQNDASTLTINQTLYVKDGVFELDAIRPGSLATDDKNEDPNQVSYLLEYETESERSIGNEWLANPRELRINHDEAVILSDVSRELPGRLRVTKGQLLVNGNLTVGNNFKIRNTWRRLEVTEGAELQADTIRVHERMTVNGTVKTNGGDIYSLGSTDDDGHYVNFSSEVYIRGKEGSIDLGEGGTLHLGPALTEKRDGLIRPAGEDGMPFTAFSANSEAKRPFKGNLNVTSGSKFNSIQFVSHIDTLTFDGTATPNLSPVGASNERNLEGIVFIQNHNVSDSGVITLVDSLRIDSLSAQNGWIRFWNTPVLTITKDMDLTSAIVTFQSQVHLKGNLTIGETGALQFDGMPASFHSDADRFLMIERDFHVKAGKEHPKNTYYMPPPSSGLSWTLGDPVPKTVMGDYRVDSDALQYSMAGSTVILHGDVHFAYRRDGYPQIDANLEFRGSTPQTITAASVPFGDVLIHNPMGILLEGHVSQAADAKLTLSRGVIGGDSTWTVMNPTVEENLVRILRAREGNQCGINGDQACSLSIEKGSRRSYVSTALERHIQFGVGGNQAPATGGYLFPVGRMNTDDSYYRPLILQLPSDLDTKQSVTVSSMSIPEGVTPDWPDNIIAPAEDKNIILDVYSDIFWKVDMGENPLPSGVDVRVAADGLANINVPERIRIVQWDCEWQNPSLAGRYDPTESDDETFSENGFNAGVLNITQESVTLQSCSILGIASNGLENPIQDGQRTGGQSMVQLIHNAILSGPVNVTLNGSEFASDVDFQSATKYRSVPAGTQMAVIQPSDSESEAQSFDVPLGSLEDDGNYALIAHGATGKVAFEVLETRLTSLVDNRVDVRLVHGSSDLEEVTIQIIDDQKDPERAQRLLVRGFMFDQATRYLPLNSGFQRLEVLSADAKRVYNLDLNGFQGKTLILNLSNTAQNLEIFAVDDSGPVNVATTATSINTDIAELPTEFALYGNYPNPFNPSTQIQFDLPESAQVSLNVINVLGREVMVLPEKDFEAGADRTIELTATNLASGTYLYRIVATGAERQYVKTGRMTLMK